MKCQNCSILTSKIGPCGRKSDQRRNCDRSSWAGRRCERMPNFTNTTDLLMQDELTRSSNMQPAINITTQMFLRTLEVGQIFTCPGE